MFVCDCQLLFLDEPTSGLDSFSASNIVRLFKKIGEKNAAVLCTIHQPSSDVFVLFDLCIFVKAGRILYQGPVDTMVEFFNRYDFCCPANYNPSDYLMNLCQVEPMERIEASGLMKNNAMDAANIKQIMDGVSSPTKSDPNEEQQSAVVDATASFTTQLMLLTYREWQSTQRDSAALIGRFGVTILLSLLYGLIFLGVGNKDNSDPTAFSAHFGAVTMVSIASMFGTAQPVMLSFPFERPMFMREYSTGTCELQFH
jgi:hypothetical protein